MGKLRSVREYSEQYSSLALVWMRGCVNCDIDNIIFLFQDAFYYLCRFSTARSVKCLPQLYGFLLQTLILNRVLERQKKKVEFTLLYPPAH